MSDDAWTVVLPPAATELPIEVFLNGVPQREGVDYERAGGQLRFGRPLSQEGKLGWLRWLSMFLGIAGTYRKHDSVDVVFELGGRRTVVSGLAVSRPDAR